MANDKIAWRNLVKSDAFPRELRSIRATLLLLSELMDRDGVLHAWTEQMIVVTGLPLGTVKRHLATAVRARWLTHLTHGGHGRRGRYAASYPAELRPIYGTQLGELRPIYYTATSQSCGPSSEPVRTDSASDSEHEALDQDRGRRNDHNGSPRPHRRRNEKRSEEKTVDGQFISPDTRSSVCREKPHEYQRDPTAGDHRPGLAERWQSASNLPCVIPGCDRPRRHGLHTCNAADHMLRELDYQDTA